jgi:hypothetical protein
MKQKQKIHWDDLNSFWTTYGITCDDLHKVDISRQIEEIGAIMISTQLHKDMVAYAKTNKQG